MKIRSVIIMMLLIDHSVQACSCLRDWSSPQERLLKEYKSADAIVLATAVEVKPRDKNEEQAKIINKYWIENTTFKLIGRWKGNIDTQFETSILVGRGMCGIQFQQGETYLLYLYKKRDGHLYSTSICQKNRNLVDAEKDVRLMEKIPQYPAESNAIFWRELARKSHKDATKHR